jgi:cell division protease FtsH
MQMPKEDRYLLSIEELKDQIAVMMGGRAAEHVMLGTISTGAVDDIQRATQLARRMVTEFGMSEKLGSVRYAGQRLQYLGTAVAEGSDASAATQETIDAEVRRLVGEQFERATTLVAAHRDVLSQLSAELLKSESLDGSAVRAALSSAEHAVASGTPKSVSAA